MKVCQLGKYVKVEKTVPSSRCGGQLSKAASEVQVMVSLVCINILFEEYS